MARPGLTIHPKFHKLCHLAGCSKPQAIGHLELLWLTAYESGDPIIGDDVDVELVACWDGEPGKLFKALLECGGKGRAGFIEPVEDDPDRYQIHDLFDHAPRYVKDRWEREAERREKGKTVSELRAEAGRKGAAKRWQTDGKPMANGTACYPQDGKPMANGATPAPAPAPAPAPKDLLVPPDGGDQENGGARKKFHFSEEDQATARWMFSLVETVAPGAKPPSFDSWANDIRLMRERDHRSDAEIRDLFTWANQDGFWKTNVLCPDKLRDQWTQLTAKRKAGTNGHNGTTNSPNWASGPGQRYRRKPGV